MAKSTRLSAQCFGGGHWSFAQRCLVLGLLLGVFGVVTANFSVSQAAPAARPRQAAKPVLPKAHNSLQLPPLVPRPGYVIGRAVFSNGRPLPEFDVSVVGRNTVTSRTVSEATGAMGQATGHNGRYTVKIISVDEASPKPINAEVVQVFAETQVNYRGQTYRMELCPLDGKNDLRDAKGNGQLSSRGVTRDFALKINGRIPGKNDQTDIGKLEAYYGQRVRVTAQGQSPQTLRTKSNQNATLIFTFMPQGPLLDGTRGHTVTRQLPIRALDTAGAYLFDIPIGTYKLRARIVNGGDSKVGNSKPLSLHLGSNQGTYAPTITLTPYPPPQDERHPTPGPPFPGAEPQMLSIKF